MRLRAEVGPRPRRREPGLLRIRGDEYRADVGPDMPTEIGISGPTVEASGGIFGSTPTSAGTLQNHKVRDKLELV